MVKPGFLQNDEVADWLGGIEPMWTHLEFESYCRLRRRPDEDDRAMHLATDLSEAEGQASPIAVALLALLQLAGEPGGGKLTTGGSLSRAVITPIAEICDGPAYDLALMRSVTKVLNEGDVWPAELLRHVGIELGLFLRVRRSLVLTRKGRAVLSAGVGGDLVATLFSAVFWRINLGHWDGYPIPTWPQSDVGVIAWSLAHAAATWETPAVLVRYATVPVIGVLEAASDFAGQAFELRILRMLALFGLVEARKDPISTNQLPPVRRYRKTALYDRFLSFDVVLESLNINTRH